MKSCKIALFLIMICTVILTGCGKKAKKDIITKCNGKIDNDTYVINSSYEIVHDEDGNVSFVTAKEELVFADTESEDYKEILESFKETSDALQSQGYVTIEYEIKDNTIISTTYNDYSKMTDEELKQLEGIMAVDGKINLDKIKSIYSLLGFTCDK